MSADLSDELASLTIAANSTPRSSEGANSHGSSPPSTSPIPIQAHPSAPMLHAQPLPEGEIEFDAELAAKSAAINGEHQRRVSGFAGGRSNNKLEASDRRTVFIPNLPRDASLREVSCKQTVEEWKPVWLKGMRLSKCRIAELLINACFHLRPSCSGSEHVRVR